MVGQEEKKRMLDFIVEKMENSGLYQIINKNSREISLQEKSEKRPIKIILHNYKRRIEDFLNLYGINKKQGIYTANVFFKNGEDFFVRLAEREAWRREQSLKNYSALEINQMISLRGLEKTVIKFWGNYLTYYQPEGERSPEALKIYLMKNVLLDYSHLPPDSPSLPFVHNQYAIEYKLPKEIVILDGVKVDCRDNFTAFLIPWKKGEKPKQLDLF